MSFLFFFIGIIILLIRKQFQSKTKAILIGLCFVIFFSLFISIFLTRQLIDPIRARKIIKEKKYLVIEGKPENYHPMPPEGHDEESFDVQGVHFHYSDYSATFGYHNAASLGGVIFPDNFYRITYFPEQDSLEAGGHSIIKIEVRE